MAISEDGELNRGSIIITVHHRYSTVFWIPSYILVISEGGNISRINLDYMILKFRNLKFNDDKRGW